MQHGHAATVRRRGERGVALVECALVLPFLLLLVMGIAEVGRMTRSQFALAQAAREGAQAAARGMPVERIAARVLNTAEMGGLARDQMTIAELSKSTNGSTWQALGNVADGSENNANRTNLVRIHLRYRYAYLAQVVFRGSGHDIQSLVSARRN